MKPPSDSTILVADHGLFQPLALHLAKSAKRVLYYSPCEDGFPNLGPFVIGDFPPVERCDDIWPVKHEIDAFVFPDIGFSGLQLELESQGYPVWGSRKGDQFEVNRAKFLRTLKEVGLPMVGHELVTGLTELRTYLIEHEDKYVKISRYRGAMETWHHETYETSRSILDRLAVKFGPLQDQIPFVVTDPIETDIELGGDTYCVGGQWPDTMLQAYEWKDCGLLGAVKARADMGEDLLAVMDAFGPKLWAANYRNFWSMELRKTKEAAYFIDACARAPAPGLGAQLEVYDNIAEIILAGANGELVQPEPNALFVVEAVLKQKPDKDTWGQIEIDDKLLRYCRFSGCCRVPDTEIVAFPPEDDPGEEVGWLTASGDTIEEAIAVLQKRAASLPKGLSADTRALIDLIGEVQKAEAAGVEFTDQTVPDPSIVLEVEA